MAEGPRRNSFSEALQNIQTIATICAILVGGIWTYLLFVEQRQRFAHLKIEHNVTHLALPDHRIVLMLDIIHTNVGSVKVSLSSADIRIYNLQPDELTDAMVSQINSGATPADVEPNALWTILGAIKPTWSAGERAVEPGESDRIHYEFILSDDVGPLLIYSYFPNPTVTGRAIGWYTRSVYDPRKRAASATTAP